MTAINFLLAALLIRMVWPKLRPQTHWLCPVLVIALPFCAGGFHTGTCAVLSVVLMLALLERIHHRKTLRFSRNLGSIAVLLLFAAYCVSPLWAADRGMAAFAFPRYLPLVLYGLFLMQEQDDTPQQMLQLIPVCGCLMTAVSIGMLLLPDLARYVIVNQRLSSFFQYPNSYAAFLLAGMVVQLFKETRKWDFPVCLLLTVGIILSGCRTIFLLLLFFIVAIPLVKRQWSPFLILVVSLILGIGFGYLFKSLDLLDQADRFTQISSSENTFLVRLLYYWDAILFILSHPFGVGYMGYAAIEGTIQTGRYYVTYIHNGLLQLLLEVGWVPSLLMAWVLLRALLSSKNKVGTRMVLLAILAHCMLDFDLQFPVFWILILSCLDLRCGKQITIPFQKAVYGLVAAALAVCLWLGCGDWLYRSGRVDSCLALTPFHTKALEYRLTQTSDPVELEGIADDILRLHPTHSVACSAKANAAFARGDMLAMIQHKENAIRFSPYTDAEYCDYFQKLYTAMELYLQAGDQKSAAYCRDKLLAIPAMLEATAQKTHSLAYRIDRSPVPVLPPEYLELLELLESISK